MLGQELYCNIEGNILTVMQDNILTVIYYEDVQTWNYETERKHPTKIEDVIRLRRIHQSDFYRHHPILGCLL